MAAQAHDPTGRPLRSGHWQDWAILALAVWLFISPWVLQFGTIARGAATSVGQSPGLEAGGAVTATWNAGVLALIVALVALSAIRRMELWQERLNMILAVWIFAAPWILGFSALPAASWDHWLVGALIFVVSLSMLARASHATAANRPPVTH